MCCVERLLTDPVQELLRAAQGVLKMKDKYGEERLEQACARAIHFNSVSYKSIKNILKKGLEGEDLPGSTSQKIAQVYQGFGLYQRPDTIDLTHVHVSGHA